MVKWRTDSGSKTWGCARLRSVSHNRSSPYQSVSPHHQSENSSTRQFSPIPITAAARDVSLSSSSARSKCRSAVRKRKLATIGSEGVSVGGVYQYKQRRRRCFNWNRLVPEMTNYASGGTLNPAHSLQIYSVELCRQGLLMEGHPTTRSVYLQSVTNTWGDSDAIPCTIVIAAILKVWCVAPV